MEKQIKVTKDQLNQAFDEIWQKHVKNGTDQLSQQKAAHILVECMNKCNQTYGLEQAIEHLKNMDHDKNGHSTKIEVKTTLLVTTNLIALGKDEEPVEKKTFKDPKNQQKKPVNPLLDFKKSKNGKKFKKHFRGHLRSVIKKNELESMEWIPIPKAIESIQSVGKLVGVDIPEKRIINILARVDSPKQDGITSKEFRVVCKRLYLKKQIKFKDLLKERSEYIEYLKALSMKNAE